MKPGAILWEDQQAAPLKQNTFGPGVLIRAYVVDASAGTTNAPTEIYDSAFDSIVSIGMRGKSTMIARLRDEIDSFRAHGWLVAVLDWDRIRTDDLVVANLPPEVAPSAATEDQTTTAILIAMGNPKPAPTIVYLRDNMESVLNAILRCSAEQALLRKPSPSERDRLLIRAACNKNLRDCLISQMPSWRTLVECVLAVL